MRTIIKIIGVQEKRKGNSIYYKTLALLDDGSEAWGFSEDDQTYKVNDKVEHFYDHAHNEEKIRHKPTLDKTISK
jgi:hypothetical protein